MNESRQDIALHCANVEKSYPVQKELRVWRILFGAEAQGRMIHALRDKGYTIVLVEQMAAVALQLADRAYVLENGRVKISGTGAELARNPEVRKAYLGG